MTIIQLVPSTRNNYSHISHGNAATTNEAITDKEALLCTLLLPVVTMTD
jgi:hypothetical protein